MKVLKCSLLALAAFTLIAALTAAAIHRRGQRPAAAAPNQRFEVRGQIRGFEEDDRTVRIAHEEIPGYMAAMTMPLTVRDAALLRGLKVGDDIAFQLVVTEDDSWISRLDRISESSPAAEAGSAAASLRELQRVQAGETVLDFTLVDQNGQTVRLRDQRGKAVLLTFIYTRCPLPNFCPLMSKNFASLQERLQKEFPARFHLISVSIDPAFDNPEVMKGYSTRWSKDPQSWTFGSGSREQIETVTGLFGLVHESTGGLINHDLRTVLIGPDGKLVHVWKSNLWTPYEVQRRVQEVLHRDIQAAAK